MPAQTRFEHTRIKTVLPFENSDQEMPSPGWREGPEFVELLG